MGIRHIGGPADAGKVVELTPGLALDHDKDVAAGMRLSVCAERDRRGPLRSPAVEAVSRG